MHVADIDLAYRHPALDERKHVGRVLGHDKDVLLGARLADHVDRLLQGEEARGDACGCSHLHEVLTHGVGRDVVVGDEDEVGTQGGVPLSGDLAMNQSVIDAGKENVGLCHCGSHPFLVLVLSAWVCESLPKGNRSESYLLICWIA